MSFSEGVRVVFARLIEGARALYTGDPARPPVREVIEVNGFLNPSVIDQFIELGGEVETTNTSAELVKVTLPGGWSSLQVETSVGESIVIRDQRGRSRARTLVMYGYPGEIVAIPRFSMACVRSVDDSNMVGRVRDFDKVIYTTPPFTIAHPVDANACKDTEHDVEESCEIHMRSQGYPDWRNPFAHWGYK